MRIDKKLALLREQKGCSAKEVAAAVGVKEKAILSYESGKEIPSPKTIGKIAEFYGFSLDELFEAGLKEVADIAEGAKKAAEVQNEQTGRVSNMKKILIINGPNLDMLGKREPEIYGSRSLEDINRDLKELGEGLGAEVDFYQSNIEGELVNAIHSVLESYDGAIINAGAYTHYSVAIHDAIAAVAPKPFIEVHLSNVHTREDYRHKSMLSPVCKGVILGFGEKSYRLALKALCED